MTAAPKSKTTDTVTRSPKGGLTAGPRRSLEVAAAIAAAQAAVGAPTPPEIARQIAQEAPAEPPETAEPTAAQPEAAPAPVEPAAAEPEPKPAGRRGRAVD